MQGIRSLCIEACNGKGSQYLGLHSANSGLRCATSARATPNWAQKMILFTKSTPWRSLFVPFVPVEGTLDLFQDIFTLYLRTLWLVMTLLIGCTCYERRHRWGLLIDYIHTTRVYFYMHLAHKAGVFSNDKIARNHFRHDFRASTPTCSQEFEWGSLHHLSRQLKTNLMTILESNSQLKVFHPQCGRVLYHSRFSRRQK